MRFCHFLLPLGTLLLSSCEPSGGSFDSQARRQRESLRPLADQIPSDAMSHAQISAQDSVGQPPLPRNLVAAVEDLCPVHHEKMRMQEVPIVFEGTTAGETPEADDPATTAFPFAAEKIVSTDNALLPSQPLTARVYLCASCIAAKKIAEANRPQTEAPFPRAVP